MKSKGLGDTIAKITEATGIDKLVDKVTDVLGIEDCGCAGRREALNNAFPYQNNKPHQIELVAQNIADFTSGIYMINNNLIFTRDGVTFDYKVGDRIFIKEDHPYYKEFQEYFQLGIISKI